MSAAAIHSGSRHSRPAPTAPEGPARRWDPSAPGLKRPCRSLGRAAYGTIYLWFQAYAPLLSIIAASLSQPIRQKRQNCLIPILTRMISVQKAIPISMKFKQIGFANSGRFLMPLLFALLFFILPQEAKLRQREEMISKSIALGKLCYNPSS